MPDAPLVISEVFGPTFQGEGPALGRRCGFVRLGRCNLACAWCDTKYSWDWSNFDPAEELTTQPIAAVMAHLATMAIDTVVVTGGEPLLQQRRLAPLLELCHDEGWSTHIETAGTLAWQAEPRLVDHWVVSPKLANSGMGERRRLRYDVLRTFVAARASFKFVVTSPADLDEIAGIVAEVGIASGDVWVMAEGVERNAVMRRTAALANPVLARGWNLTTRLHVLAWGGERGH